MKKVKMTKDVPYCSSTNLSLAAAKETWLLLSYRLP